MTIPPHPIIPPMSRDDEIDWLRLLRSRRVGPSTFFRLMGECGSAAAALDELPKIARDAGITDYEPCPLAAVRSEIRAGQIAGARLVAYGSTDYPKALMDIADAPPLLWMRGRSELLARPMVAVVGARNASSLGLRMAKALGVGLAEAGYIVVSGLARGIDTAAHEAALRGGTLAVLAGGVDVVYPPENAVLMQEIGEQGLCLSEQAMGLHPIARHFPRRNRLVSGLCRAVVVVEAAAGSGSLITAGFALDQGREVMAVPGHPFDARASGCNRLIRDGALLVRGAEDVIAALARPEPQVAAVPEVKHPELQQDIGTAIIERLGVAPMPEEALLRDLSATTEHVGAELARLEIEGRIARHAGGLLTLVA